MIRAYLDKLRPDLRRPDRPAGHDQAGRGRVGVDIEGMKKLPSGGYEVGHSSQVIGFDRTSGVVLWTPETPVADLQHDFGLLVEKAR